MIHRESGREKREKKYKVEGTQTRKKKKKIGRGERWALPGTSEKSKSIWKSSYCFWTEPMFFCYFQVCGERKLTPTCQAMNPPDSSGDNGDSGSIPGLGRYPGVGNWQPTPLFLPGKFHGPRSLVGFSSWDPKELVTTEYTHTEVKWTS